MSVAISEELETSTSSAGSATFETLSDSSLRDQVLALKSQLQSSQDRNHQLEGKLASLNSSLSSSAGSGIPIRQAKRSTRSSFGDRTNGRIPVPLSPGKRSSLDRPRTAQGLNRAETPTSPPPSGFPSSFMSPPREEQEELTPGPAMRRRTRMSTGSHQTSLSHIPIAVVGSGRILTSSAVSSPRSSAGGSPAIGKMSDTDSNPTFSPPMDSNGFAARPSGLPRPPSPAKSAVRSSAAANPFFGGGSGAEKHAARLSSAATGSSRVIDNLQAELATTRGALEEAKAQLRLSQRAIESLNRQVTDLTDSQERARIDLEGLSSRYQRKERMLEEVLQRARTAEASLEADKDEKAQTAKRLREYETRMTEAEARSAHDRSRYDALRNGHNGVRELVKREVAAVRQELAACRSEHANELSEARRAHQKILSTLHERDSTAAEVRATIASFESARKAFVGEWTPQMMELADDIRRSAALNAQAATQAEEIRGDLMRIRRQARDLASASIE